MDLKKKNNFSCKRSSIMIHVYCTPLVSVSVRFPLGEKKVGEKSIALPNKKNARAHSYLSIEVTPLQWLLSSVPKVGGVKRFICGANSIQVFL